MSATDGPLQRLLWWIAGAFGKWALGLYYLTVRIVVDERPLAHFNRHPTPAGIFAFWHSHQLSIAWYGRRTRSAILISRSRDGEYIARIARAIGYRVVRGSSSRGGAPGLREMIALAAAGRTTAITPDGPRGPRHDVKQGVIAMAQKAGQPIIPTALGLSRFWELPSWDRFRIPKPFSRGYYCWGEPLRVPPDASDEEMEKLAAELRRRMIALEAHADRVATRHSSNRR